MRNSSPLTYTHIYMHLKTYHYHQQQLITTTYHYHNNLSLSQPITIISNEDELAIIRGHRPLFI